MTQPPCPITRQVSRVQRGCDFLALIKITHRSATGDAITGVRAGATAIARMHCVSRNIAVHSYLSTDGSSARFVQTKAH
jgi:hypothetical protein